MTMRPAIGRTVHRADGGMLPRVIYLAGYGRSGSTIFERVLSARVGIVSRGEIFQFFHLAGTDVTCSCGAALRECSVWGLAYDDFNLSRRGREELQKLERCRRLFERGGLSPFTRKTAEDRKCYAEMTTRLLRAIADPSVNNDVLDSSKTAYQAAQRPASLKSVAGLDVRVIHLVRDIRAAVWSGKSRGRNRDLEAGSGKSRDFAASSRAAAGWRYANEKAAALRPIVGAENYILVRYEDFVGRPEEVLGKVAGFLGRRTVPKGRSTQELTPHQLAGNRSRYDSDLAVKPDFEWISRLSRSDRALALTAGWPLAKQYGYV